MSEQPQEVGEIAHPWHAYFNVHGDPFVVEDPDRPQSTIVATVSTAPDDYGRANALLLAAAPDLAKTVLNLLDILITDYEQERPLHPAPEWMTDKRAEVAALFGRKDQADG